MAVMAMVLPRETKSSRSLSGWWKKGNGAPVQEPPAPLVNCARMTYIFAGLQEPSMSKKGQHVVPTGGKWSVRTAGASRASGTFSTQEDAIADARARAKQQGTELYVHGRDGRIRERRSFGKDPYPPKG
jgi:hypothetical protein